MWWSVLRRRDVRPARPVGVEKKMERYAFVDTVNKSQTLEDESIYTACFCDLVVEKYGLKIG